MHAIYMVETISVSIYIYISTSVPLHFLTLVDCYLRDKKERLSVFSKPFYKV